MTEDVEAIAGKLSKAQREALLRHAASQGWGGRLDRHLLNWSDQGRGLKEAGLIEFVSRISSLTKVTRLGERVRASLASKEQSGG